METFLVRLTDPRHHAYLQKNPFLNGPDAVLNRELRSAWQTSLEIRRPPRVRFTHDALAVPLNELVAQADQGAVAATCARLDLDRREATRIIQTWAWKIARAPRNARKILSLGCGAGHELIVLRALFPHANIDGVDYEVTVPRDWCKGLRIGDLRNQDVEEYLSMHPNTFDLVFSNHTLEHVSAPEHMLGLVREALVPGGTCVAALPLEGDTSNPFYYDLLAIAEKRYEVDPHLDLEFIGPSHAWKTNREDLAATLCAVGFSDIRMFSRADYPSYRYPPLHISHHDKMRVVGSLLERATLRTLRRVLRRKYPCEMPRPVIKAYYSIATRCWFSRVKMLHSLMHEVVVVATTASGGGQR
jgi:SAM-dependent methyltransferase